MYYRIYQKAKTKCLIRLWFDERMETFSWLIISLQVYGSDSQVPESAQTATALLCGEKTNFNVVGLKDSVGASNCSAYIRLGQEAEVKSIIRHAIEQGKTWIFHGGCIKIFLFSNWSSKFTGKRCCLKVNLQELWRLLGSPTPPPPLHTPTRHTGTGNRTPTLTPHLTATAWILPNN